MNSRSLADFINLASFTTYLIAISIIFFSHNNWINYAALITLVLVAAVGWFRDYRRFHLIADTPTSRIQTAAQGFVEIMGNCEIHPGETLLGFRSGPPCVWYRYTVSRTNDHKHEVIDSGQSDDTF